MSYKKKKNRSYNVNLITRNFILLFWPFIFSNAFWGSVFTDFFAIDILLYKMCHDCVFERFMFIENLVCYWLDQLIYTK